VKQQRSNNYLTFTGVVVVAVGVVLAAAIARPSS
jgi:uncharacterized protein YjeT (DUF2065 family)